MGERPGGTAGIPGGTAGTSFDTGGGDCGDAISCGADPASDSTATDAVGDRGTGGGGGAAGSLPLFDFKFAGVTGRLGNDDGVEGREEEVFIAPFLRTSARAGIDGVVVEPDRC